MRRHSKELIYAAAHLAPPGKCLDTLLKTVLREKVDDPRYPASNHNDDDGTNLGDEKSAESSHVLSLAPTGNSMPVWFVRTTETGALDRPIGYGALHLSPGCYRSLLLKAVSATLQDARPAPHAKRPPSGFVRFAFREVCSVTPHKRPRALGARFSLEHGQPIDLPSANNTAVTHFPTFWW